MLFAFADEKEWAAQESSEMSFNGVGGADAKEDYSKLPRVFKVLPRS